MVLREFLGVRGSDHLSSSRLSSFVPVGPRPSLFVPVCVSRLRRLPALPAWDFCDGRPRFGRCADSDFDTRGAEVVTMLGRRRACAFLHQGEVGALYCVTSGCVGDILWRCAKKHGGVCDMLLRCRHVPYCINARCGHVMYCINARRGYVLYCTCTKRGHVLYCISAKCRRVLYCTCTRCEPVLCCIRACVRMHRLV